LSTVVPVIFCGLKNHLKLIWALKNSHFPVVDGYATGLRRSVNMTTRKLIGLKSQDYYIIMERLLPIIFRGYFDYAVWMVLVELS
jgi:hypothetical protein